MYHLSEHIKIITFPYTNNFASTVNFMFFWMNNLNLKIMDFVILAWLDTCYTLLSTLPQFLAKIFAQARILYCSHRIINERIEKYDACVVVFSK